MEEDKAINVGEAAHIRAAASGGPRYDPEMSRDQRKHISNAIWLCGRCAKLIDSDVRRYTVALLKEWKALAENLASNAITGGTIGNAQQDSGSKEDAAPACEAIELGDNNDFAGGDDDLKNLATRCAIGCIDGKPITFSVTLRPTVLNETPTDPLWLPTYEAGRRKNAAYLTKCLTMLCAPEVYRAWRCHLSTVDAWQAAITTLINGASTYVAWQPGRKKVDVWRTQKPQLSASIEISSKEYDALLRRLEIDDANLLRMGVHGGYFACDMPDDIIVKHLIPRLVNEAIDCNVPLDRSVLSLMTWHIGEG